MKQSVVLIGACVMVLLGAWMASRALSADVTVDAAATPAPSMPAPVANAPSNPVAVRDVPSPALPPPQQPVAQPTVVAPTPQPPTPPGLKVDSQRMTELAQGVLPGQRPAVEPDPSDEAPSPFTATESPELDYAEKLLAELDGGVERLKSARDVFARCVEAAPALQRCQDGLAAAQLRLGPEENGTIRPDTLPMKGGAPRTNFPTGAPKAKLR